MQFILHFHTENPLILPIGYHSEVQGLIYHILSENPDYSSFLHNQGYMTDGRSYKVFVFSLLNGKYGIRMPKIIFQDDFRLEVRSPGEEFCSVFAGSLMQNTEYELNGQPVVLDDFEVHHNTVSSDHVQIEMLSPLCLHQSVITDSGEKKTHYLSPIDEDFDKYLNINLEHKMKAFKNQEPAGKIHLTPLRLDQGNMQKRDKYVTRFAGRTIINAWRGRYDLTGDSLDLSFLYDAGIGTRNSQGFGMFRLI